MYRFLLTRRWLAGLALALVLAALCVLLGTWQWDRREQRLAANAPIEQNYDAAPQPPAAALPAGDAVLARAAEWTPVRVTGRYLSEETLLLRNRPLDGRPGYHVLLPLQLTGGDVLLVDRGWVPIGATGDRPDVVPLPPSGEVEAVVRLRRPEEPSSREAPQGQLYRITPASVSGVLPGAYGVLEAESPAPASAPVPLPRPQLDEGPHLSYSLQWFVFAAGVLVGYGVLARRTAAEQGPVERSAGGREPADRPVHRLVPRGRRRVSAEDEEDAILEAAERTRVQR